MSLPGAMPSRRTPSTSTSKGRGRVPVVTVKPVPCSPTMPVRVCTAGQAIGADGLSIDAAATAGGDTAVAARSTPSAPDTATPAHDRRVDREDRELTVITLLLNEVDNPSMKLALLPAVARIIETRVYRARPDRVGPASAGYIAVTSRGLAPRSRAHRSSPSADSPSRGTPRRPRLAMARHVRRRWVDDISAGVAE